MDPITGWLAARGGLRVAGIGSGTIESLKWLGLIVMVAEHWMRYVVGELPLWNWSRPGLLAMAYLVVFSACLAYLAYGWLARHATPAQVGTYSYVNPALAAVVGYVGLGEQLTALQVLGAAVILAGVLLINWPSRGPALARVDR